MAQPGRPKRRNKIVGNAYAPQMHHQQQHLQQQQQFRQIKEDNIGQIHDEADLVSYRSDALNRYISNHDYIENITAKHIHTSKIIPPSVFPTVSKTEERNPQDLYFGDLEYMRKKAQELIQELKEGKEDKEDNVKAGFSEKQLFQRESVQRLAELQTQVLDDKSLEALESELDNILDTYTKKYNTKFEDISLVKQYSVPVSKISNIEVKMAPENYNPRLINSLVNMNSSSSQENKIVDHDIHNAPISNGNLEHDQFDLGSGMFLDQFNNGHQSDYTSNSDVNNSFTMQVMNRPASTDVNNEDTNDKSASDRNIIDDEINDLFNENNQDNVIDSNPVDDPMGELINFDGNEDEDDLMPSNSFEQDFLSQIDHSME